MNAQLLGALADIVREAIASSVEPLNERLNYLESVKSYDDTSIRQEISDLKKSIPTAYDDKDIRDAISSFKSFDDTLVMEEINSLKSALSDASKNGKDGKDGLNGLDGKDALQLEIYPAIDTEKSYARGSYAKHNGGLWRAFEQTSEMRGWECIVDGIASVDFKYEGKEMVASAFLSSGSQKEFKKFVPSMVYKGVWTESEYLHGDTATWAGSLWHCNVSGTAAKPGDGSGDWTLAVKKGRDASAPVSVR